jgi:tetratricopeptide (TPR) repeat protein
MTPATPSHPAAEALLLASDLAAEGRFEEAEAAFANAVLLAPDWAIARYQLGLLQFSSGRAAAALVTWAPLGELDAADPLGHYVRGFASLAQDDFAGAASHFREGLACAQDNPAVAGDIEKVLARIGVEQAAPAPEAPQEPATAHVLLSNYGRVGNLH